MASKEVSMLDYVYTLVKRWKFIVGSLVIICLVTALISLTLTDIFKATTTILPPSEEKQEFGFSSLLSNLSITGLVLGEKASPADIYMGIIKSRTVTEIMVDRFDLMRAYNVKKKELAIIRLSDNTNTYQTSRGLINIDVYDKSSVKAAQMANAYVTLLDSINLRINNRKAVSKRQFLERRLNQNKVELKNAEDTLKLFQDKKGVIAIPAQAEAAIQTAAGLKAQIMALEVEHQLAVPSLSPTHPKVVEINRKIKELERQISSVQFGDGLSDKDNLKIYFPISKTPDLSLEYARLLREVDIQSTLFQLLTEQYEQAKIEEANTTSTVQVLDPAEPPELKAKPKRSLIVLSAGFFSIFLSIMAVLAMEYYEGLKREGGEEAAKLERIMEEINLFSRINGRRRKKRLQSTERS